MCVHSEFTPLNYDTLPAAMLLLASCGLAPNTLVALPFVGLGGGGSQSVVTGWGPVKATEGQVGGGEGGGGYYAP